MIKVTLGNGEIKEFDAPLSAFDAARELGEAKTACAAEIDLYSRIPGLGQQGRT